MNSIQTEPRLPFRRGMVYGLTGNPGAGKSTVALILQEKGAQVLVADALGYSLLQKNSPVFGELIREFGESIQDADGEISRAQLGQIVFSDPIRLNRLNQLVHPHMLQALRRRIEEYRRSPTEGPLILDAALIFEWDIANWFDRILVVSAPPEVRQKRFETLRSGALSQFEKREASQLPQAYKEQHADVVIYNLGNLADLRRQVEQIFSP